MSKRPPDPRTPASAMMDTREVAAYLRLKERRIYDLVKADALPHVRATGKLLFPRAQIEAWLGAKGARTSTPREPSSPIIAGSHDPLLEWAVRASDSGLAVLACGSSGGLARLADGTATIAALHWLDVPTGEYNVPLVRARLSADDVVVVEWARRVQGLVLAHGNPLRMRTLADVARRKSRVVERQPGSGSRELFAHLAAQAGMTREKFAFVARTAQAETDLAAMIRDGKADAGIAIEAAARAHGLAFVPLATERFDLALRRRDYFEPPMQALLAFTRMVEFREHAAALGGYDVTQTGRIVFNA